MATTGMKFRNQATPSIIDDTYIKCDFTHSEPTVANRGVRLFPGDDTPRTFIGCKLGNCLVPPGSTVDIRCNTAVRRSRQYKDSEWVTIGGEQLEIKNYVNKIYGHYDHTNPQNFIEHYVEKATSVKEEE